MWLYQALTQHGLVEFLWQFLSTQSHHFHPPLIPALTTPFYLVLGPSFAAALWFNTVALVLFYSYAFKLIKRLMGEMPAAVAVVIMALFPMTYGLARVYMLEFGLAAIVVIWLYYFYQSDVLAEKRYLPWLGLLLGAGLLTKVTFPMYVIGPVSWEIFRKLWRSAKVDLKVISSRFLLVGALGGLLALPWYWKNSDAAWTGTHIISGDLNKLDAIKTALSGSQILQFLTEFLTEGISAYFFVLGLVLVAILTLRRRRIERRGMGFLLAWWLPVFLIVALGRYKIARYAFPVFPALAALLALVIVRVLPVSSTRRVLVLGGLLLIPLGNYLQLSFFDVWTWLPQRVLASDPLGLLETNKEYQFTYRVRGEKWPLESILEVLQKHTYNQPGEEIYGIMRFWLGPLARTNLMFLGAAKNIPLLLDESIYENQSVTSWLEEAVINQADYEYLVIEQPIIKWSASKHEPTIDYPPASHLPSASIVKWFKIESVINTSLGYYYKQIAAIPMPASSQVEVLIYQRSYEPINEQQVQEN
jgi:hypothetical protein